MKLAATTFLTVFALCVPSSSAAPVCVFGMVPCFVFCGGPPQLKDADEAALRLRKTEYEKLNRFDEISALATTQFGKCIGINGWKRYHFRVWAVGTVDQAATSWDGLRTVDIVLENFNGYPENQLLPRPRYIRAEIIRRVWKHVDHPPCRGDHIRVEGELHWDGHGFLEIHPRKIDDLRYLPASIGSITCSPAPTQAGT
jgi:hypothetical protein